MVNLIIYLIVLALMLVGLWKTFEKAGKPGWAAIVPIYNIIVLLEIAGKPVWWIILYLIPIANFIVSILVAFALAETFGKSKGWAFLMLVLLPFVGYPMLGFSDATYTAPAAS